MRLPWYQRLAVPAKLALSHLKPYLRWLIVGGTLFFLAGALKQHWHEVTALRLEPTGWNRLIGAFSVTLLAHIWTGWVWSWILREFHQPVSALWGILVYLKTNIAKYLPGNVWHLYGRVVAAKNAGFSWSVATLSVLLEPLLMAAAALAIALIGVQTYWQLQALSLAAVLLLLHPRILNPLLQLASRLKGKSAQISNQSQAQSSAQPSAQLSAQSPDPISGPSNSKPTLQIKRYPLLPLLGEMGFVLLRGSGFLLTLWSLSSFNLAQIPAILSAFSVAWMLGLVIPGAPGGIGVFEVTALALLNHQLPTSIILGTIALYRLISILAEAIGAALAYGYPASRLRHPN
jgi:uncharacterized membrane protein YbhN (UPF0104 family)